MPYGSLKAALNVVVAEGQVLEDPEDLPHRTIAQIGSYAHLGQDSLTSGNGPGVPNSCYPPPYRRWAPWFGE